MQINIAGSYPVRVNKFHGKINIYFAAGGPIYLGGSLAELLSENNGVNSGIAIVNGSAAEIAWSGDLWVACPTATPSSPVMVNVGYQYSASGQASTNETPGIKRAFSLGRGAGTSIY